MIEKKEMKKTLGAILSEYGFKYVKKGYYFDHDELVIIISIQKSDYSNSYYVNYGFFIKAENPGISYPLINRCDIFGRFVFEVEGTVYYNIEIENFDLSIFKECIRKNVENIIVPVIESGLRKYFELCPQSIVAANQKAKKYLRIES